MRWFRRHAAQPRKGWTGPVSFVDWSDADIAAMSKAIRVHGQPDSKGWQMIARVALNTLRGGDAVELVARAIEAAENPGSDPDLPVHGGHYMHGMPRWCVWVEYARPAVEAYAQAFIRSGAAVLSPEQQEKLNQIYDTAKGDTTKIDKSLT